MIIDLPRFVETERPTWTELEDVLKRMGEEPDMALTIEEAKRFHYLYQKVSADLGRIATFASEPALRQYLESLVARAYAEIHETRERGVRWHPVRWFLNEFPAAFRRHAWGFNLAVIVTLVGMIFGGFAVSLDGNAKAALMPKQFANHLGDPRERVAEEEAAKGDPVAGHHSTFAGELMTNNIGVSINAMAFGMTWGLGTLLILFKNGILVGLIGMDYVLAGQTVFLFGWLLPHGSIEIPAILIGGQAGFVLGRALIGRGDPAPMAWRLRVVGRDVATLVGGLAVMLVWAGIVESYLSQHHQPAIPYWIKIAFGTAELILLAWFLSRGWRAKGENA